MSNVGEYFSRDDAIKYLRGRFSEMVDDLLEKELVEGKCRIEEGKLIILEDRKGGDERE